MPNFIKQFLPVAMIALFITAPFPALAESVKNAEYSATKTGALKPVTIEKVQENKKKTERKIEERKIKEAGNIEKRLEKSKERLEETREKIASKTAALKVRLQKFKDQRKATVAEKINTNLNSINQNRTSEMQKHISTMTTILDKLGARVNREAADIKDPVAARGAITSARQAIAEASAAVLAQEIKDYTIQVSSESAVRIDAKTQRDKLFTDLLALRKTVINARQSVAQAISTAKAEQTQKPAAKEGTISGRQ